MNTFCTRQLMRSDFKKTGCRNIIGYARRWKNNRIDEQRMKYMGADKPAAEWILLNKGKVKMSGSNKWISSFWDFPQDNFSSDFRLTHIQADNTEVSSTGFRYIKNLAYIQTASFAQCRYVDDSALPHLHGSADSGSLKALNLSKTSITQHGIRQLAELKSLKHLDISDCKGMLDIPFESELPDLLDYLKSELPKCAIILHSGKVLEEQM
ncbi:ATP synthase subunit s, mitochondrial-like [Bolinopsis microptera]|uniref:ATP synthase subunit s, mitochondrial-like n=1 Tax=Bolinopsis microptera TaxID=2820187 RepID=UPI00307A2C82